MRSALALLPLAVALAGASAPPEPKPAPAPSTAPDGGKPADLGLRTPGFVHPQGDTDCAACHTAEGWRPVSFAHERTGFPLEGRHREVTCKSCHQTNTFADPIPRACSACHRDPHLGRLGQRCQDCHDPTTFASQAFGPEAHRRTNFPLTGRHALLACEECHGDRRDRGFDRPTTRCAGCHEADLARATSGGAAVDHATGPFASPDCRNCHATWRFAPALFSAHQACFDIRRGPHASIRCIGCHTNIPPVDLSGQLTCNTDTANCIGCHRHSNEGPKHAGVAGFAPVNRKCYECHRFAPAP
jgi:hypothetical protein